MSAETSVLLVGFGNMGQALVKGLLERGRSPHAIHVVDPEPAAVDAARRLGVGAAPALSAVDRDPSPGVVLLAVKPAQLGGVLGECRPFVGRGSLFLSIAAGKPIAALTRVLGPDAAVVRAMPNTPAAIGRGMTVLTANRRVSGSQRAMAEDLMAAVGAVEWVDDEALMDPVTAVSGSGPAYVFLLVECLAAAGVAAGLDRALATRLATVTVAGAGAYAELSGEDAAELRRRVTSPGGTTEAALGVLMGEDGLGPLLERAVAAATARSRALSEA
ncbi:MAG TPA: pyrroline-5-carboxylate reductase [Gammaproteobacteria bacterium]|nr:pyrroline-5-carboxylate reductase [Gammaproteobacteria bacterium]